MGEPLTGISVRSDAVERPNGAAALAAAAWMLSIGIVYAAANIGDGPTIWTTLAPAAIGTLTLTLLMMTSGAAERITIGRIIPSRFLSDPKR